MGEEKAHERWERMDKDGDGELTKQEAKDGQGKFSDDKVDDMWPLVDKDKSGTISFGEFVAFMKAKKKEKAREPWDRMDRDGDGELTKQEVKHRQDKFSDEKVDEMWPLVDKDKSGTVSLEEFFMFMKGKKEEAHKHCDRMGGGWMRMMRMMRMDKDGDGELTKQEAKDGQDKFSDDKVDDMWPEVDKDKSGTVSMDELFSFMRAKKEEKAHERWER